MARALIQLKPPGYLSRSNVSIPARNSRAPALASPSYIESSLATAVESGLKAVRAKAPPSFSRSLKRRMVDQIAAETDSWSVAAESAARSRSGSHATAFFAAAQSWQDHL